MTDKLVKALNVYRSASDPDEVFRGEEMIEEALTEFAEKCRREAIQHCRKLAAKCGHVAAVWEGLDALLE